MQIHSVRQQFIADHSSTNYLFYAAKPLSKNVRAVVSRLSSHVDVSSRRAEITYHSEFADLGEERRKKFLEHYDVEVREDYDWWTLSVMLEEARLPEINFAAYKVEDEASLTFEKQGKRIRLRFEGCHLDYNATYDEFGEELMKALAELGLHLREEIYAGTLDALEVMSHYCGGTREPSRLPSPVAKTLGKIMERL
jgi:hypothetical protein